MIRLEQSEDTPSPRAGHSMVFSDSKNHGFLFGGANHETGFLDDLYKFNVDSNQQVVWTPQKVFGSLQTPTARYEHFSAFIDDELTIMFGAGEKGPLSDIWKFNGGMFSLCQKQTVGGN